MLSVFKSMLCAVFVGKLFTRETCRRYNEVENDGIGVDIDVDIMLIGVHVSVD